MMKAKRTILLVDDERLVLATLTKWLVSAGFTIVSAESVDDAESTLASGERPDLVILDMHMPGRSGLELAERLRCLDNIPFMLLTAYGTLDIVDNAAALGALGYLVKPVNSEQLLASIEAALARAEDLKKLRSSQYHLQTALDAERDISIAIGIVMVQQRLARKEAFEVLRKKARSQSQKLVNLAEELIAITEANNAKQPPKRKC